MKHRLGIHCPGLGVGGPWRYVHSLLRSIDPEEFDVVLFSDMCDSYPDRDWIQVVPAFESHSPISTGTAHANRSSPQEAVQQFHESARHWKQRLLPKSVRLFLGYFQSARALAKVFQGHDLDLLHTQNTGCEPAPIAAKFASIPHVMGTFHVDSTYDLHRERSGSAHRMIEMISNRCLDSAISVSDATKHDWLRRTHIPSSRVTTIWNGIDPEHFRRRSSRQSARTLLGLPVATRIIGGVGRLDHAKGFEDLLKSFAMLRNHVSEVHLVIAGEGPLRQSLEAHAHALGIIHNVHFLGYCADVQPVLDALDVYAIPSLCEALPFALLEAMATGLPAIGSTVGGIPEVILEGVTGFLVPPRNPGLLACRLQALLEDEARCLAMGNAGRERVVRHFHVDDMVRRTLSHYRMALRGRESDS